MVQRTAFNIFKWMAILNCELRVVAVPLNFRHKILTLEAVSDDVAGWELGIS